VVAALAATAPVVSQAQEEFLPPVIDRSSGRSEAPQMNDRAVSPIPAPATQSALSLDNRVTKLERLMENQALVDMLMRLDSVQNDTQELRGEMENLLHAIEEAKQRQRDLYLDIDRRLRQAEVAATAAASSAPLPSSPTLAPTAGMPVPTAMPPSAVQPAMAVPIDPAQERQAYQKAFDELKSGQYDKAIVEFQNFLALYPAGDFTDNAQYWLGEANYVTRRFEMAEKEFQKVLQQHPDSTKASDAMLKLGYTYYELGQWDLARETLTEVVSRFPNMTVSRLAGNRLQKMRLEGR
jgi:tol-pal system protein YbgF